MGVVLPISTNRTPTIQLEQNQALFQQSIVTYCALHFSACGLLKVEVPAIQAENAVDFRSCDNGLLYRA